MRRTPICETTTPEGVTRPRDRPARGSPSRHADRSRRGPRPHQRRAAQGALAGIAERAAGRRPDAGARRLDHDGDARALGAHGRHPARGGGRPGRRLPHDDRRAGGTANPPRAPARLDGARPAASELDDFPDVRCVAHASRTMRGCCSPIWSRRPPPSPRRARGWPRSRRSPTACAGPRPARSRSSSATSRASCGSGAPASAGRLCATCRRPRPRPACRSPRSTAPSRASSSAGGPARAPSTRGARSAVRPRHRRGAALPGHAGGRRAAPGRARRHRHRRRRGRRRVSSPPRCAGRRCSRGDLPAVAEAALTQGAAGLGALPSAGRAPGPADARQDRAVARGGAGSRSSRQASSGSSTACASRCTATATTSPSSRARSIPSGSACRRSSRLYAHCRCARSSSTARRSRSAPTDGRGRSRRPRAAPQAAATSTRCARPCR